MPATLLTSFAQIITPTAVDGSSLRFHIPDDWLQGRSSFGGLQAALALTALRRLVPHGLPLRVLQTSFAAPVPGGEVAVSAKLIRAGKNVTLAEARIEVEGATACLVVGIFGAGRDSAVHIAPGTFAPPPGPEGLRELPWIPGVAPNFLQHFRMRWGLGLPPFCGGTEPNSGIWLRHHAASGNAEADLVALADAIPSPTLSLLKKPAPASSLTWTLELLEPAPAQGEGWWRLDSEVHAARDGYVAQSARLHAPDGRLVGLSRQAVVIFA